MCDNDKDIMTENQYDVYLQVYNIQWNKTVATALNRCMRWVGLGGIYHTGLMVHGREFDYGYVSEEGKSGIKELAPKQRLVNSGGCFKFTFRKSIYLGTTDMTLEEIRGILDTEGKSSWPGTSYSPISQNCNHFSYTLATGLGVEDNYPCWINRPARFAGGMKRLARWVNRPARLFARS